MVSLPLTLLRREVGRHSYPYRWHYTHRGRSGVGRRSLTRHLTGWWLLVLLFSARAGTWEPDTVHFAVIGDYGSDGPALAAVAHLVHSWQVNFIITVGDNNYPRGSAKTIDRNIGQYFHDFIYPYRGHYGPGATENRFFPALGNHDWYSDHARPYLDYFQLPGNERYYDFVRGPVHFFCLSSDRHEPDGIDKHSRQAQWLKSTMTRCTHPWKVVYLHHPPYSSAANHGSTRKLQWPFRQWGASVVLAGHDHVYERLQVDGLTYFVNGLGGKSKRRFSRRHRVKGSQVRFSDQYGAMRVTATRHWMKFQFIAIDGEVVDTFILKSKTAEQTEF